MAWRKLDISHLGALNGFYLVFAIISKGARDKINQFTGIKKRPRLDHFFQVSITFILACFAWIFFRANNVSDSFIIIKKIFTDRGSLFLIRMILLPLFFHFWEYLFYCSLNQSGNIIREIFLFLIINPG